MKNLLLSDLQAGQVLTEIEHEVSATDIVLGAMASRDWRPMHHDSQFARERSGKKDIFMNSPNQAAWFERYINDVFGPLTRIRRLTFKMKRSIYPGTAMALRGEVSAIQADEAGGNVELRIALLGDGELCSECQATVSVPVNAEDNPWRL
jgi:acyl dehydratase